MTATVVHDGVEVTSSSATEAEMRDEFATPAAPGTPAPAKNTQQPIEPPAELPAQETEAEPDPASEAGKKLAARKKSLQERLDETTFHRRAAERERDEARRELETLRRGQAPPATPASAPPEYLTGPKPQISDIGTTYEDYDAYVEALTDWKTDEKLARHHQASRVDAQTRVFHETTHQIQLRGRAAHADFDAKAEEFTAAGRLFTPFMSDAIFQHPKGEELAYALMTDPALYQAIASAPTWVLASVELGKFLTRLDGAPPPTSSSPTKPVSAAPPPVTPVRTGLSTVVDGPPGDDAPIEAHFAYYDKQEREAKQRR